MPDDKETPPYKHLKEYTEEELYIFLNNNEEVDLQWLAGICSEILRRSSIKKTHPYLDPDFEDWLADEELDGNSFAENIKSLYRMISRLNADLKYMYDLVPIKYKIAFPKGGSSPFFTLEKPLDPKEYEEAKKRMASLLRAPNEK